MKLIILVLFPIILSHDLLGQNEMVSIENRVNYLMRYHYETENNEIDIYDNISGNMSYTNVYFSYLRNPKTMMDTFLNKLMKFKINYEYLVQSNITDKAGFQINIQLNNDDEHVTKIKIAALKTKGNGKPYLKKMKQNKYDIIQKESSIKISIEEGELFDIDTIRIIVLTELYNLSKFSISTMNLSPPHHELISINIPEIFKYELDAIDCLLKESKSTTMVLKTFSLSDPERFIEDYRINSKTSTWEPSSEAIFNFRLTGFKLPEGIDIGMDSNMIFSQ